MLDVGIQKFNLGLKLLLAAGGRLGAFGDLLLERFDGFLGRFDRIIQCLFLVAELNPQLLDTQSLQSGELSALDSGASRPTHLEPLVIWRLSVVHADELCHLERASGYIDR